jgi:molecular chaperone DnaJ
VATDFYELLGVAPNATEDEIKRAYRKLARELHPDANGGNPAAEERFKEVTLAYETLRDPERRRRYDVFGPDMARGAGAGDPFAGMGFGSNLGDLFDTIFGGAGRPRGPAGPPRGNDLEVTTTIEFVQAVFGAQREVDVRAPVVCATCDGSGASAGTTPVTCTQCNGTGEIRRVRQSILGQMVTASPCNRCGGLGEMIASPCPDCRGEGRRTETRTYTVDVPAGVDDGNTLRLTGRGAAGPRGGAPGDLYVHLRVRAHERFQRQGHDLLDVLHIPMTHALLGVHLTYETLDGVEDLVISPGTQSGRVFRLRGRGVPHVNGRGRGELLVQVVVDIPTELSPEQEELVRRLAAERGEEVAPPEKGFLSRVRSAFK